ncbi:MAG: cystine transporter subunit [Methanoregulaceae archaeon PtaU1.Bin222]|nr:MAG: cystine transporter subunit [Methanoregulaceae archaeon PtaU1.Bin222]
MHKKVMGFIVLSCIFILSAGCVSAPQESPSSQAAVTHKAVTPHYIVGVDANFPPFASQDRDGNITGFDIDALRWIAGKEGFEVEFVSVPWDQAIPLLEAGNIDLIASGMMVNNERRERVNFSQPYYTVSLGVAIRTGSGIVIQDIYDGRIRVGAQAGSTDAAWVVENLIKTGKMPASNLSLYPDITNLTRNLEEGNVDAAIIQSPTLQQDIAGRPLVVIGTILSDQKIAYAVRKSDPELLARIDEGLSQLMKDPLWDQLKQQYGLE